MRLRNECIDKEVQEKLIQNAIMVTTKNKTDEEKKKLYYILVRVAGRAIIHSEDEAYEDSYVLCTDNNQLFYEDRKEAAEVISKIENMDIEFASIFKDSETIRDVFSFNNLSLKVLAKSVHIDDIENSIFDEKSSKFIELLNALNKFLKDTITYESISIGKDDEFTMEHLAYLITHAHAHPNKKYAFNSLGAIATYEILEADLYQ